jgi:hypothetical protein
LDDGATALSALSWAASKNLTANGHVILWPEFNGQYTPDRFASMTPTQLRSAIYAYADGTARIPFVTANTLMLLAHVIIVVVVVVVLLIAEVINKTRQYIHEWDVINEPLENNDVQGNVASPGVSQSNGVLGNAFSAQLFDHWYERTLASQLGRELCH